METGLSAVWIIILFHFYLDYHKTWFSNKVELHHHYIRAVRDTLDAELPNSWKVRVVQDIGQLALQISHNVTFSCGDTLKTKSTNRAVQM